MKFAEWSRMKRMNFFSSFLGFYTRFFRSFFSLPFCVYKIPRETSRAKEKDYSALSVIPRLNNSLRSSSQRASLSGPPSLTGSLRSICRPPTRAVPGGWLEVLARGVKCWLLVYDAILAMWKDRQKNYSSASFLSYAILALAFSGGRLMSRIGRVPGHTSFNKNFDDGENFFLPVSADGNQWTNLLSVRHY